MREKPASSFASLLAPSSTFINVDVPTETSSRLTFQWMLMETPSSSTSDLETSTRRMTSFGLRAVLPASQHPRQPLDPSTPNIHQLILGHKYEPILADIWSSGVTLYAMVDGHLPFDEHDKSYLYKKITSCQYTMPVYFSDELKDLIKRIFVKNPTKRISIQEMKSHPWLKKYGQDFKLHYQSLGVFPLQKVGVNLEICAEVAQRMGVDKELVAQMVSKKEHNKFITCYYLLLRSNFHKNGLKNSEIEYLKQEAQEKFRLQQISKNHYSKQENERKKSPKFSTHHQIPSSKMEEPEMIKISKTMNDGKIRNSSGNEKGDPLKNSTRRSVSNTQKKTKQGYGQVGSAYKPKEITSDKKRTTKEAIQRRQTSSRMARVDIPKSHTMDHR